MAYLAGRVTTAGIFQKLLPRSATFMFSLLVSSGSIARVTGPLMAVSAYNAVNNHSFLVMSSIAGLALINLLFVAFIYRPLGLALAET